MKAFVGVIFMFCIYMDLVQGSCLSYGHSCWGGHGKRGLPPQRILRPQMEISDRWALVKLMPDKSEGYPIKEENLLREISDIEEKSSLGNIRNIENLPFAPNTENEIQNSNFNEMKLQDGSKNGGGVNKSKGTKHLNKLMSSLSSDDETDDEQNIDDIVDSRNMRFYKMLRPLPSNV